MTSAPAPTASPLEANAGQKPLRRPSSAQADFPSRESGPRGTTSRSGPAAVASGAISCVLAPEMTQGPYYVPNEKLRRNITEGKAGVPLELRLTVVDASKCKPIKSAAVDIWHADAGGVYSGAIANNAGTNFLRGIQRTDRNGLALFESIYP